MALILPVSVRHKEGYREGRKVNSGKSIYEVAKVLGHSQLKISARFSHLSQEALLAAANAKGTNWE